VYRVSTLGATLEQRGFIHCSFREQVQGVADLAYRGRDDVVLLEIDPDLLVAPVRAEEGDGGGAVFPHLYGPLNRDAVVRVVPVRPGQDGRLRIPL
jgi:uncharacterized protein (DUF952 family)